MNEYAVEYAIEHAEKEIARLEKAIQYNTTALNTGAYYHAHQEDESKEQIYHMSVKLRKYEKQIKYLQGKL